KNCISKEKLDKALDILRLSGNNPIKLVTNLYYARSIDYTISLRTGFGGTYAVTPTDLEKIKDMVTELVQQKPGSGGDRAGAPSRETGSAAVFATPSTTTVSTDGTQRRALADAIKAELDRMSSATESPNAPAVSGTFIRSDAGSVTLRQTFAQ